jgi:hypothetical protein
MRMQHANWQFVKLPDCPYGGALVRVVRDHDSGLELTFRGIDQEMGCEVHV